MINTWNEWGEVYDTPDFWRDEVVAICDSNGIEARSIDSTFPGTHAVFFVNQHTVLKMFCPIRYNSYEKELRLHNGPLAGNPLFARILFHGKSPGGYDYIAFTRFHGRTAREVGMTETLTRDLARAIAELQAGTLQKMDGTDLRCLVHYDLTEEHIFVDSAGVLEGIIDFGDAEVGHPADEFPPLFIVSLNCNESLISAFRETYDETAAHRRIDDEDLAKALLRHPYRDAITNHLRGLNTLFAKALLRRAQRIGGRETTDKHT